MCNQNNFTVGQWCDRWFRENQSRWSGNTVGGYRNLIDRHISPGIGNIPLTELTQDTVTGFYDSLRSQGLSARSVWCVHLLLRRCMGEAARDQLIPCNPVQICPEPPAEGHRSPTCQMVCWPHNEIPKKAEQDPIRFQDLWSAYALLSLRNGMGIEQAAHLF